MHCFSTDSEWNFVINTHKTEFVRFYANSMTVSLYSSHPHVVPAVAADAQARATNWSTVALDRVPNVYFDPSVMGTSLVKGIRVTINGVPVQTNSLMEPHLLHYVRCARIFNSKPGPYIARQDQLTVDATVTRATIKNPMKAAFKAFDHVSWENQRPNRVPIFWTEFGRLIIATAQWSP